MRREAGDKNNLTTCRVVLVITTQSPQQCAERTCLEGGFIFTYLNSRCVIRQCDTLNEITYSSDAVGFELYVLEGDGGGVGVAGLGESIVGGSRVSVGVISGVCVSLLAIITLCTLLGVCISVKKKNKDKQAVSPEVNIPRPKYVYERQDTPLDVKLTDDKGSTEIIQLGICKDGITEADKYELHNERDTDLRAYKETIKDSSYQVKQVNGRAIEECSKEVFLPGMTAKCDIDSCTDKSNTNESDHTETGANLLEQKTELGQNRYYKSKTLKSGTKSKVSSNFKSVIGKPHKRISLKALKASLLKSKENSIYSSKVSPV